MPTLDNFPWFLASLTTTTTPRPTPKPLTVSVLSKEITLPDNSAVLTAHAVPEPKGGGEGGGGYQYEWMLINDGDKQQKAGNMKNGQEDQLTVTDLKEGVYRWVN